MPNCRPSYLYVKTSEQFAASCAGERERAGIRVLEERDVVIQRLNQDEPGQLGKLTRRMAEAGVNIEVLYSDHEHRLILVVDKIEEARAVAEAWTEEREARRTASTNNDAQNGDTQ